MAEITDADRRAAAAWAKRNSRPQQAANILRGSCDTAPLVQAFAAHRRQERDKVDAWLRGIGFGDEDQNRAKYEIMQAIASGAHDQ